MGWNDFVSENIGWDDGVINVGAVSVDTGLGGVVPEEAEVIVLEQDPAPFPWEWIAAGGVILFLFYAVRR